jgi:formate dehydrogenase subunit gamma
LAEFAGCAPAGHCARVKMGNTAFWDPEKALACIRKLEKVPGALLPILHLLQEEFGYIDETAVPIVADVLNLSIAEVHGVISFYHDFRQSPPGSHILQVCRAEACQSMSCDQLVRHIEARLGIGVGETSQDGSFTLQQTFCLGLCAVSPALMLDGKPYGRVSTTIADSLINSARRQV